jgi:hypothetical protein
VLYRLETQPVVACRDLKSMLQILFTLINFFFVYFIKNIFFFKPKSGFTRVSNYLSWIDSHTFSSRVLLKTEVEATPLKVKQSDPLSYVPKYEVTIDVYQDNQ